jgi:hypothetical protein
VTTHLPAAACLAAWLTAWLPAWLPALPGCLACWRNHLKAGVARLLLLVVRFNTPAGRTSNSKELYQLVQEVFLTGSGRDEWLRKLEADGIICAVRTLSYMRTHNLSDVDLHSQRNGRHFPMQA